MNNISMWVLLCNCNEKKPSLLEDKIVNQVMKKDINIFHTDYLQVSH